MTTSGTPTVSLPDVTGSVTPPPVSTAEGLKIEAQSVAIGSEPFSLASTGGAAEASTKHERTGKRANKSEPETLAQVLDYAYGRKGQPLALKPKAAKRVAQNPQLGDSELSRLLQLMKGDKLLAVPRQILLLSQEVKVFPSLKAALVSFVADVMLRHPVFSESGIQGALRNLPDGLQPAEVLTRVAEYKPSPSAETQPLKDKDLRDLRYNAAQLFVTWLAVNRSLNSEELSSLLFQVVWQPAAKNLADDTARLRALTDIGQVAGVGLACQRFQQQAIEARVQQDQAQRETAILNDRLLIAEKQLSETADHLAAIQVELMTLKESSRLEMEALRHQHAVERTHLQHQLEQLRGRLVKRLTDSAEMLDIGLSALRKETPRVQVMVERAEHVVDALRAEVQELREG